MFLGALSLWVVILTHKPPLNQQEVVFSADGIFQSLKPLSSSVTTIFSHPREEPQSVPVVKADPYPNLDEIISLLNTHPQSYIQYNFMIHRAAGSFEIDPDLLRAIILVESRFQPDALSPKGAGGLMQLMPDTAKELGVTDVFDPEQNINAGSKYFRRMLDMFDNNPKLALAAYNAGRGAVKQYDDIPP